MPVRIARRVSAALLNSLAAGVAPRIGLEYIAVGRKHEISTLLEDLENVAQGGASFRFIIGRYGSGKSFLLQLIRNHAMERDFVVADADLSPERRLTGAGGQGLATYRELLGNLATRTRPEGGALPLILERWISNVQSSIVRETGMRPNDGAFNTAVEDRILAAVAAMEGMVHGFDFTAVLTAYWRGYLHDDDALRDAALRWLRGEFTTKTQAREALGVRVIIDDATWYDYLKLLAHFVASINYKGLVVLLDEAVNLYKISHTAAREGNYEKLLTVFNDAMQGRAAHLGILMGGTPQFVEDPRRGLYSYEALRSRLGESRFNREGLRDLSGPTIRLSVLTHDEIYVLLTRLAEVHAVHHGYESSLTHADYQDFLEIIARRLGSDQLLTPREVIRDFVSALNILRQNPAITFAQLIHDESFQVSRTGPDPEAAGDAFAEFTL